MTILKFAANPDYKREQFPSCEKTQDNELEMSSVSPNEKYMGKYRHFFP